MGPLCISLTTPATLEHLKFKFRFGDYDYLSSESLRDLDAWSHLDSITSHPAGSRLQRVDININAAFCYDVYGNKPDKDRMEKAVFDGLPLLRTKGILFVEMMTGLG